MSPYTEGTVVAVVFICSICASFFGEVSVAQSVEMPYIAMLGDVAASVQVQIPRHDQMPELYLRYGCKDKCRFHY